MNDLTLGVILGSTITASAIVVGYLVVKTTIEILVEKLANGKK